MSLSSPTVTVVPYGNYNPSLTSRLSALEAEKADAEAKRQALAPAPMIDLHPSLPALYRRKVETLQAALNDPELRPEASEVLRALIARIVLTPVGGRLAIKLYGDLAEIVAFSEGGGADKNGAASGEATPLLSVVAGRGFEPLTFRL